MRIYQPLLVARLLVTMIVTTWLTSAAWAAVPTHIDRRGATRIAPAAVDLTAGLSVRERVEAPKKDSKPGTRKTVGVHVRYVSLPDWLMDAVWDEHPKHQGMSVGAEFGLARGDHNALVFEVDYTSFDMPATNWLEVDKESSQANFIETNGVGLVSADVTYRRTHWLGDALGLHAGGGLGVGFFVGDLEETPVLPTCQEPIAACEHWSEVGTKQGQLFPIPVLPVLHLQAGIEVKMVGPASVRFEVGFRNVAYVGGGFNVEL